MVADMATPDAPRWLDDEEMAAWLPLMGLMVLLPAQLDAQMQRMAELTQFEYLILSRLSEEPDHTLRISTLAGQWFGSLSRLSHLMKRLEGRGLVRRRPAPEDGRYTNATLTDEGLAKVVAVAPLQVDLVRQLVLDNLTRAQLRQTRAITERLLAVSKSPADCVVEPGGQGSDDPCVVDADVGQGSDEPCVVDADSCPLD
jgi:DNA-binding MarR family transcriptional regulator